jgi:hypothetical protein
LPHSTFETYNPVLRRRVDNVIPIPYAKDRTLLPRQLYKESFLDSVARGISDVEKSKTYSTEQLIAALATRRKHP